MWLLLEMENVDSAGEHMPNAVQARALNTILKRSDTLSRSVVELLSCPYTSCSLF